MKDMISLTLEQQQLVEHYLSVVNWVIIDHIKLNPQVCGLGYSDVYQEGCVHLCRAAATYQGDPAGFGAYARTVVRNGLLSYCRSLCRENAPLPLLTEPEDARAPACETEEAVLKKLRQEDLFRALHEARAESSGVVRLGIEALELKAKGLSGREIAALYGVKPNHVGAWISRAASRLRLNPVFLQACGPSSGEPNRRAS